MPAGGVSGDSSSARNALPFRQEAPVPPGGQHSRRTRRCSLFCLPPQQILQRSQALRRLRRQAGPVVVELEQVDVEIAQSAGLPAEPGELLAEAVHPPGRQDPSDLAQRRAGAAHRDPEIVQELRVEIAAQPVLVAPDRVEQLAMDAPHRQVRGQVGLERDLDFRPVVARVQAAGLVGGVEDRSREARRRCPVLEKARPAGRSPGRSHAPGPPPDEAADVSPSSRRARRARQPSSRSRATVLSRRSSRRTVSLRYSRSTRGSSRRISTSSSSSPRKRPGGRSQAKAGGDVRPLRGRSAAIFPASPVQRPVDAPPDCPPERRRPARAASRRCRNRCAPAALGSPRAVLESLPQPAEHLAPLALVAELEDDHHRGEALGAAGPRASESTRHPE